LNYNFFELIKMNLRNITPLCFFLLLCIVISTPLFTLPIQLFPGVIEINRGIQHLSFDAPLSLAYFVGLGMNENDLDGISNFYLKPAGYMLAFIFTIGIPLLVALRLHFKRQTLNNK